MIGWRTFYRTIEGRVAGWNPSTETWNVSKPLPNLSAAKFTPMMDNDQRQVFGVFEKFLSAYTGVEVELEFTGKDDASIIEMTGFSSSSSGSGAGETRKTNFEGGKNLPYFGLILSLEADDGGDSHILLPYGKLDSLVALEMAAANKFVVPNIKARFGRLRLLDNTVHHVMQELEHAVVTSIATDFDTAFADLVIA